MLIERIIDLCFSLDCVLGTQKTGPSRVTCWSLKSCQSCRSPDCHYRRVVSFHQETDECGDKYLLTFHSPSSLPRVIISFIFGSHSMFLGELIVKLFFVEGTEILPLILMGILKTSTSVFRLEEGRRKGFKHPKSRGKKLVLLSLWENKKNELKCITLGRG